MRPSPLTLFFTLLSLLLPFVHAQTPYTLNTTAYSSFYTSSCSRLSPLDAYPTSCNPLNVSSLWVPPLFPSSNSLIVISSASPLIFVVSNSLLLFFTFSSFLFTCLFSSLLFLSFLILIPPLIPLLPPLPPLPPLPIIFLHSCRYLKGPCTLCGVWRYMGKGPPLWSRAWPLPTSWFTTQVVSSFSMKGMIYLSFSLCLSLPSSLSPYSLRTNHLCGHYHCQSLDLQVACNHLVLTFLPPSPSPFLSSFLLPLFSSLSLSLYPLLFYMSSMHFSASISHFQQLRAIVSV